MGDAQYDKFDDYIVKYLDVLDEIDKDKNNIYKNDKFQNKLVNMNETQSFIDYDLNRECVDYNENPTMFGTISMLQNLYTLFENDKIPNADDIKTFVCGLTAYINDRNITYLHLSERCTSVEECFKLMRDEVDPSERELILEQLKTDVFLSQTLFKNTTIEYLSKGANSSADKIKITTDGKELYLIQKSNLKYRELHRDMIREFIIGVHLLLYVRDKIPNFTMSYGIYGCSEPIIFKDATKDYIYKDYDRKAPFYDKLNNLIRKKYNIYENIDKYHNNERYIANIDQDNYNYYLLTDYSKGFNLQGYIEVYGDEPNLIVDLMFQAVRALVYAYKEIGYVHNDFHTGNSIVTEFTDEIYIEDPLQEVSGYKCHKTNILLKIFDYGYSSINGYPRYQSNIFSDNLTNVHNDILKFGLGLAEKLLKFKHYDSLAYVIAFILAYYFDDLRQYDLDYLINNESFCLNEIEDYINKLQNNKDNEGVRFKYNPHKVLEKYGIGENRDYPVIDVYKYMIEIYKKNEDKFNDLLNNNCNVNFYQDENLIFKSLINKTFSSYELIKIKEELHTLDKYFNITSKELTTSIDPEFEFLINKDYIHLIIESMNSYVALVRLYTYVQLKEPQIDFIFNFNKINANIKNINNIIEQVYQTEFDRVNKIDNKNLDVVDSPLKILYNLNKISYI